MCVLLVCFTQRKELMKIIRTEKHEAHWPWSHILLKIGNPSLALAS